MSDLIDRLELAACHAVHGPDVMEAIDRIKELELQLMCVSDGSAMHVMQLEAKLDAVKALPDKWREVSVTIGWDMATNEHVDELEAVLASDPE